MLKMKNEVNGTSLANCMILEGQTTRLCDPIDWKEVDMQPAQG